MENPVITALNEQRAENDKEVGLDEDGPIRYLNMDADDFNMMSVDELFSASAALNSLSFQVQRFQSDNEASANRLERYINKIATVQSGNYTGFHLDERKTKAIMDSETLKQLDSDLSKLRHKAEQHKYLATSINNLATTLNKKADTKSRLRWKD